MLAVTAARIRKALLKLDVEVRLYTALVSDLSRRVEDIVKGAYLRGSGVKECKFTIYNNIPWQCYVWHGGDGYGNSANGWYCDGHEDFRPFYTSNAMSKIGSNDSDNVLMPLEAVQYKFRDPLEALRAVTPIRPKRLVYILAEYKTTGDTVYCSLMQSGVYRAVSAFRPVPKGDDLIRTYTIAGHSENDCENCTDCADCGGCDGCKDCSNCADCDSDSATGLEGVFTTGIVSTYTNGSFSHLHWRQSYTSHRDFLYENIRIPLTDGDTYDTWLPYYGDAVAIESDRVSTGDDNYSCGGGSGYRGTAGQYHCLLKGDTDAELVDKYNAIKPSVGALASGYGVVVGSDNTIDRLKNADGYTPISDDGYYINIIVSSCDGWDDLPNASKTVR